MLRTIRGNSIVECAGCPSPEKSVRLRFLIQQLRCSRRGHSKCRLMEETVSPHRGVQRVILPPPRLRPAYKLSGEIRRWYRPEGRSPKWEHNQESSASSRGHGGTADALALGANDRKVVGVQIPLPAPNL